MNNPKNALADDQNDTMALPDHDVKEIGDDELEQVCGGTTAAPDCTGGGGVHD